MIVTALQGFDHGGKSYRRGQTLNVTSHTAKELRRSKLVSFNGLPDETPRAAGGADTPSSASLPAQASPQTTANESDAGETPAAELPTQETAAELPNPEKPASRRRRRNADAP